MKNDGKLLKSLGRVLINSQNDLFKLLHSSQLFKAFEDDLLQALMSIANGIELQAGMIILHQDEPSPGIFLIESGMVKVSRLNHNGREYILTLLGQGSTFNNVTVFDQGPNPASVIAKTDCRVCCFPCHAMLEIAIRHPTLALTLAANIAQQTRHLVRELDGLSMYSVRARLARFLLNQSSGQNQIAMLLTQEELANHLGTVREMVSRSLRKFKGDGIIQMTSETITILDRHQLVVVAEL